jgi:hypothetical protein
MNGSVELYIDYDGYDELNGRLSTENSGPVKNIEFRNYRMNGDNEPGFFLVNNTAIDNEIFYEFMGDAESGSGNIIDTEMEVAAIFVAAIKPMDELAWEDGTGIMPASRGDLPPPGTRISNDQGTVTLEANQDGIVEYFTSYQPESFWLDMTPVLNGNISVALGYNKDSVDSMTFDGSINTGNLALVSTLKFISCTISSSDSDSQGRLNIDGKPCSFAAFVDMFMR